MLDGWMPTVCSSYTHTMCINCGIGMYCLQQTVMSSSFVIFTKPAQLYWE